MSTRLYSYPPFWTKNPFGPWTLAIATTIVATTNRPASGVSNPSRNRNPATSSLPTASATRHGPGGTPDCRRNRWPRRSPDRRTPRTPSAPRGPGTPPRGPAAAPALQDRTLHTSTNCLEIEILDIEQDRNNVPCVGVPTVS